jgi:hypothetical protein
MENSTQTDKKYKIDVKDEKLKKVVFAAEALAEAAKAFGSIDLVLPAIVTFAKEYIRQ